MRVPLCLSLFIAVTACADRAANIDPSYISPVKYSDWSCDKLLAEKAHIDQALPRAAKTQDEAADQDVITVFLIGIPLSGGGIKEEVARLKGEQEALRQALRDNNCLTEQAARQDSAEYQATSPIFKSSDHQIASKNEKLNSVPRENDHDGKLQYFLTHNETLFLNQLWKYDVKENLLPSGWHASYRPVKVIAYDLISINIDVYRVKFVVNTKYEQGTGEQKVNLVLHLQKSNVGSNETFLIVGHE